MEDKFQVVDQGESGSSQKFAEIGKHNELSVPVGTPLECRITRSDHPFQYYVVPLSLEKVYKRIIKKFWKEYAEMTQEEIEEATPTDEFLSRAGACVAVFYKSRWHRAVIAKRIGDLYEVCFLDTGDLEKIQRSNIRRLYKKHLEWPVMAVRCSYINRSEAQFLGREEYANFFSHVTSANPHCQVTFHEVFDVEHVDYWDADIEIKSAVFSEFYENGPGSTENKFDLLTKLAAIHANRLATGNDLYFYINEF